METNRKLLVVLGPTASGKTALSIKLAKKFRGEVVSADSRQIYRKMDIGTAKPLDLEDVSHWMLDIKNPNEPYTVAEYKRDAINTIKNVQKKGKLPILAGGTGLYIKAVVDNLNIPEIKANPLLRQKIEKDIKKYGLDHVFNKLVKLDPEAAYIIDPKNPRRIIRALEITISTKKPFSQQRKIGKPLFDVLEIGVSLPKEKLKERINKRVDQMLKDGLIKEVEDLIKKYGANQQAFDAIGYREIIEYLNLPADKQVKRSLEGATKKMKNNTWHYAKRQMTWFKPDKRIKWPKNYKETEKLVKVFLKQKTAL